MTATMILREMRALPAREKAKLWKELDRELEKLEQAGDVRLFDQAVLETAGQQPTDLRDFLKQIKSPARRMTHSRQ